MIIALALLAAGAVVGFMTWLTAPLHDDRPVP